MTRVTNLAIILIAIFFSAFALPSVQAGDLQQSSSVNCPTVFIVDSINPGLGLPTISQRLIVNFIFKDANEIAIFTLEGIAITTDAAGKFTYRATVDATICPSIVDVETVVVVNETARAPQGRLCSALDYTSQHLAICTQGRFVFRDILSINNVILARNTTVQMQFDLYGAGGQLIYVEQASVRLDSLGRFSHTLGQGQALEGSLDAFSCEPAGSGFSLVAKVNLDDQRGFQPFRSINVLPDLLGSGVVEAIVPGVCKVETLYRP